jgi:hypothetical protein
MADMEQSTPADDTPVYDVDMAEDADAAAAAAGDDTGLPKIEPETPKLVLFAE